MSAQRGLSPERKVIIFYVLMLLTCVFGVTFLIALWGSNRALNHTDDVWVQSHQLWIWRSCVAFLVIIICAALFLLPLIWWPVNQGLGLYSALSAGSISGLAMLWLMYRGIKGLSYWIKGKVVY
jgi:uncharacterized membrane protein